MQISVRETFANISKNDNLSLFQKGIPLEPKYKNVIDFLNFKKSDISKATGIPLDSIRYDRKMPLELKNRMIEWANLLNLVGDHFKNVEKTILWFTIPNPLLGGISQRDMIRFGKYEKLYKFVYNALVENHS